MKTFKITLSENLLRQLDKINNEESRAICKKIFLSHTISVLLYEALKNRKLFWPDYINEGYKMSKTGHEKKSSSY
jgi:hypothetical protein